MIYVYRFILATRVWIVSYKMEYSEQKCTNKWITII